MHSGRTGSAIAIHVLVGAAKTEISNVLEDGTIKVNLAAPKMGKQADDDLIHFLAQILNSEPSKIEILAGMAGHDKLVTILDLDAATVQERVYQQLK
jgi:uncharacterized protein YggU (UPF0235/DUF167 family)